MNKKIKTSSCSIRPLLVCLPIMFGWSALDATHCQAKVVLPHFVTDSMVVQQKSKWEIVGKASGQMVKITPSWNGKTITTKTNQDGTFCTYINTPRAGGPYTITFDDGDKLTLHDVYSGEVWLCSGQSNMEMPVGGWGKVMNYKEEIANAHHPEIRMLQIKKQIGYSPAEDTEVNMGGWRSCSPTTVENFSSIAYFYAREMSAKLGVHVGVIDCTWGGTPAEAWTSYNGVASVAGFETETKLLSANNFNAEKINSDYEHSARLWTEQAKAMSSEFDCSRYNESLPSMPIPELWEQSVLPDFNGIVYMQQRINIPSEWVGKPISLHLGMIDDEDVTYFNGEKIAEGSGYNVYRSYTVPAHLVKAGEAVITVRVTDYEGGGGIYGETDSIYAQQGDKKISLCGNWKYRVAGDFSKLPRKPISPQSSSFPTVLYNAMLHPLHKLPIKGVLWYQGCANVGRAAQYAPLFKRLITDWRTLWKNKELPFYFVQLAAYLQPQEIQPESEWAALRQAQAEALSLNNTAMAVAIDVGNPNDIHPKNKQEVARRLSLIALHNSYGKKDIIDKAPQMIKHEIMGNNATLQFDGNIHTDGNTPTGFIVRNENGEWKHPSAIIVNNKNIIKINSDEVITAIKYNWADYPNGNLRGETGLPIAPFSVEK